MFSQSNNPQWNLMSLAQAGTTAYGAQTQARREDATKARERRYNTMTFTELLEVAPPTKKEGQFA